MICWFTHISGFSVVHSLRVQVLLAWEQADSLYLLSDY